MAIELLKIGKRTQEQIVLNQDLPPIFVFSGTIDTDIYTDITSNDSWLQYGKYKFDYMYSREQIKLYTSTYSGETGVGFSALTLSEQKVASKVFAVSKTDRDGVHSEIEQEENWQNFVEMSKICRTDRWKAGKSYISYRLSMPDSLHLAQQTNILSANYLEYGIESYDIDGVNGLFDWIENTSTYSGGTGFSDQIYWTQELQDGLSNILRYGN